MSATKKSTLETAQSFCDSLGVRWNGRNGKAVCPSCGGSSSALSIGEGADGRVLLHCFKGCTYDQIIDALPDLGLIPPRRETRWERAQREGDAARAQLARERRDREDSKRKLEHNLALIDQSDPKSYVVTTYLGTRDLHDPRCPDLLFHPNVYHGPTDTRHPAMIAIVRDLDGNVLATHRTFLLPDGSGKAAISPNKIMYGGLGQGAVHLAEAGPKLLVGEGVETCLSAQQETGLPAWAALSATRLSTIALPPDVQEVTFLADNDLTGIGIREANKAARLWADRGRRARVAMPPEPGMDFNDMLRAGRR